MKSEPLIPKHGGFRKLKSFQLAQLCYDVTVRFCERYIDKKSRTYDQMVQAGRSGAQNIAEGSEDSATSKKSELKLTNIARGSLEELGLDYEDYLRHRRLRLWDNDDPRRAELIRRRCATVEQVAAWVKEVHDRERRNGPDGLHGRYGQPSPGKLSQLSRQSTYAEIAANAALVLIGVARALLDRQIEAQAKAFVEEGGFTERLYRIRAERRYRGSR